MNNSCQQLACRLWQIPSSVIIYLERMFRDWVNLNGLNTGRSAAVTYTA
jgi:hypothetical protein